MSVLIQCDAKDYLSVNRNKRRSLHRQGLADKANPPEIASERPRAVRSTFLEDFTMEHSLHGLQIASVAMAGTF